jgi:hypothetical protein
MGISVAVTYSTKLGEYRIYQEEETADLIHQLVRADLVVGFNHVSFDYEVLMGHTIFDFRDQFRDLAKELAPRAETEGSSYGTSTDTYTMREWGFHDEISDPELDSFQEPYDAFRDMTDFVTDMIWKRREVQVATRDFVTGVWGTDLDGGSTAGYDKWDDVGANPLEQIIKMMDAIEAA